MAIRLHPEDVPLIEERLRKRFGQDPKVPSTHLTKRSEVIRREIMPLWTMNISLGRNLGHLYALSKFVLYIYMFVW